MVWRSNAAQKALFAANSAFKRSIKDQYFVFENRYCIAKCNIVIFKGIDIFLHPYTIVHNSKILSNYTDRVGDYPS